MPAKFKHKVLMGLIEGFRPLASCIYISIVLKQDSPTIDYEFVARLFRIEICVADEFGVHARASYCHVRMDETPYTDIPERMRMRFWAAGTLPSRTSMSSFA